LAQQPTAELHASKLRLYLDFFQDDFLVGMVDKQIRITSPLGVAYCG
jgi:hypothetical protein